MAGSENQFNWKDTPFQNNVATNRGGLGEKSGPGVTVRPAHLIHGALPTQCIARIDQSVTYFENDPHT